MIKQVKNKEQLNICLEIIRSSFITVAEEFGLTENNCPISVVEEAVRKETEDCGEATAIKITDREGDMAYQIIYCSFTLVVHSGITRKLTACVSCSFSGGSWHESSTTLYRADTGEMIILLEYYLW